MEIGQRRLAQHSHYFMMAPTFASCPDQHLRRLLTLSIAIKRAWVHFVPTPTMESLCRTPIPCGALAVDLARSEGLTDRRCFRILRKHRQVSLSRSFFHLPVLSRLLGFTYLSENQRRENGHDGHDDKQLVQRESVFHNMVSFHHIHYSQT